MSIAPGLPRDVRYGLRLLARTPVVTTVAVVSLALGIGAATSVFTLINALMFRSLPVRDPGQLVELLSQYPREPRMNGFWWKFYEHYRDHNHVFSDLIGFSPARFRLGTGDPDGEVVEGDYVVGHFFSALGVRPVLGRLIEPADDRLDAADPAVAVVSWSYWESRWQRAPSIIGSRIVVDGVTATVIGVAPPEFSGLQPGRHVRLWVPSAMEPLVRQPSQRADGQLLLGLVARLAPGVTIDQARAELRLLDRDRRETLATRSRDPQWRQAEIHLQPAGAGLSTLRNVLVRPLLALMAIASILLLIVCANVASLLLARASARRREIAVRVALGAGRRRLLQQLLTESLLLSAAGGALGLLLAWAGAHALARAWPLDPRIARRVEGIPVYLDLHVLLFCGVIVLVTTVVFGLAPGWTAFGRDLIPRLRPGGVTGETRSRRFVGNALVASQIAVSVVLLTAAGLFLSEVLALRTRDLGFDRQSVLLATLDPARSRYKPDELAQLYEALLGRLQTIPAVKAATLCGVSPIEGGAALRFVTVDGFEEPHEARRYTSLNWVAPRYFEVVRTPIVAGRDFSWDDRRGRRVAIVNQAFARYYFGDAPATGHEFRFEDRPEKYEIVGVAGDAKYSTLREPPPRTVYLHAFQEPGGRFSQFALRTDGPPTAIAGEVRRAVADVITGVPIRKLTTLSDQVDASLSMEILMVRLSGLLGIVGAFLTGLGIYGLMAFTVIRRTGEIAVRMALGATRRDAERMVVKDAVRLGAAGVLIGTPLAFWSRAIAASVIPQETGSAVPLGLSMAAMIGVAVVAAYLPARRAARVEPMQALRHE